MVPMKTVLTYYATTFSYRLFTGSSFSCWILFLHLYHVFYFVKRVSDTKLDLHQDLRQDLHFLSNNGVGRFGKLRACPLKLLRYYTVRFWQSLN